MAALAWEMKVFAWAMVSVRLCMLSGFFSSFRFFSSSRMPSALLTEASAFTISAFAFSRSVLTVASCPFTYSCVPRFFPRMTFGCFFSSSSVAGLLPAIQKLSTVRDMTASFSARGREETALPMPARVWLAG